MPSAYPLLGYLLVRMVIVARRPRPRRGCSSGRGFLLPAIAFLAAFRVALNVADGNVIDVGYASVIGADRLAGGHELYGAFPPDNPRGDTYGPVAYAAYVPFELLFPWTSGMGRPAGGARRRARLRPRLRAAAVAARPEARGRHRRAAARLPVDGVPVHADGGQLGRQRRARRAAGAGGAARRLTAAARGAVALAGLATRPWRSRRCSRRTGWPLAYIAGFAAVCVLALAPFDLSLLWDRTLGFQQDRDSPFSVWGYYELPGGLQLAAQLLAAAFAVGVAFLRPSDPRALALAAAVLIALQLAVDHWFYLYLVWFAPLVVRAAHAGRRICSIDSARRRCGDARTSALIHGSSSEES